MRHIIFISTIVVICELGGFYLGDGHGFERGVSQTIAQFAANKSDHDATMRKIGLCSWAKVMAAQVQCQNEFKPGEK